MAERVNLTAAAELAKVPPSTPVAVNCGGEDLSTLSFYAAARDGSILSDPMDAIVLHIDTEPFDG